MVKKHKNLVEGPLNPFSAHHNHGNYERNMIFRISLTFLFANWWYDVSNQLSLTSLDGKFIPISTGYIRQQYGNPIAHHFPSDCQWLLLVNILPSPIHKPTHYFGVSPILILRRSSIGTTRYVFRISQSISHSIHTKYQQKGRFYFQCRLPTKSTSSSEWSNEKVTHTAQPTLVAMGWNNSCH